MVLTLMRGINENTASTATTTLINIFHLIVSSLMKLAVK